MLTENDHLDFNSLDKWGCSIDEQRQNLFDTGAEDYDGHEARHFAYQCLNEAQDQLIFQIDGPYMSQDLIQDLLKLSFEIGEKIAELES